MRRKMGTACGDRNADQLACNAETRFVERMCAAPLYPSPLPPVTVLCGFLGAGKTTLLNHLLSQAAGRRWAAVVNDVAAINIDAAMVRSANTDSGKIVELGNGCVCCSSRDELGETLARLAVERNYEHILVETTGVAEPRGIAALFLQRNPFGKSLNQFLRLSSLVTVIDSRHFLDAWKENRPVRVDAQPSSGPRPVFDLMVEQVECADLILLNKADLLSDQEKSEIEILVSGLNPRAERIFTEQSRISADAVLDRPRFSATQTLKSARWIQILNTRDRAVAGAPSLVQVPVAARHEERFGIRSFVFEARRPFAEGKLEALLSAPPSGLLRAKGFFWLKSRPDEMGFLSVAGHHAQFDFLNYWWAALVEHGKASRSDVPPALEPLWQEPQGDRRQELVFIGVGLDEAKWRSALEEGLVPQ